MSDDDYTKKEQDEWLERSREMSIEQARKIFGGGVTETEKEKEQPKEDMAKLFDIKSAKFSPPAEQQSTPVYPQNNTPIHIPVSPIPYSYPTPSTIGTEKSNPAFLSNTMPSTSNGGSDTNIKPYPIDSFPPVISEVIKGISVDLDIPPKIIGNIILSASAMACQPLFEVENPGGAPETCSLYNITIADSGLGKSVVFERIMPPFLKFNDEMADVQERLESDYKSRHKLWRREQKVLGKEFEKLILDRSAKKEMENIIIAHDKEEPQPPKIIDLFYNNTTEKTLAIDLSNAFNVTINTEEGHSFFKGYIKNSFDMFNELWDKATYKKSRAIDVTKTTTIKIDTSVSMSILVQPNIFDTYCEKYGKDAYEVGFFPRCFFVRSELKKMVDQVGELSDSTTQAIKKLHERFEILLLKQKENYFQLHQADIDDGSTEIVPGKERFIITDGIKNILEKNDIELKKHTVEGAKWEHIKLLAYKSREKMLRLSGILQSIDGCHDNSNEMEIKESNIRKSAVIVEWYLDEASHIFEPKQDKNSPEPDHVYLWNFLRKLPKSCQVPNHQSNYLLKNKVLQYSKFSGQIQRMNNALAFLIQSKLVFESKVGRATVLMISYPHMNVVIE